MVSMVPTAKPGSFASRVVPLAPMPLDIARRLRDVEPFFFLWSADGSGPSYVAVEPVESRSGLDPEPGLHTLGEPSLEASCPRWIGLLPYEGQRHLERPGYRASRDVRETSHLEQPIWWRFGAVVRVGADVRVIGDNARQVESLAKRLQRGARSPALCRLNSLPGEDIQAHWRRIVAAQQRIAAGDIYQVNLARRIEVTVQGHALDILEQMAEKTRPAFAFAAQVDGLQVVSTSPELFLRQFGDRWVETVPIKGTRPRSAEPALDRQLADQLAADPKENAELNMIVDVERNDLGRIAEMGSVRVPETGQVFSQGLVWHRRARVTAQCRNAVSRRQLLEATLPSGSVTGAPKIRAMEIIAELESQRRGLYTGALGYLDAAGRMQLSMAIRTLTVREQVGHYFTGGGIVADSDPAREVAETQWKAQQLQALINRG